MDIQQMKYFITAASCLNFSKAADQLHLTQPALSRQISSIEKELNIQLFIRIGHELRLTPAAKILKLEFEQLYNHYQGAVERANMIQHGVTGKLMIGVLEGMRTDDILPEMLQKFSSEYPEIEISLFSQNRDDLTINLYEGRLDVSFTLQLEVENRIYLKYKKIADAKSYLALHESHPWANREYVSFNDLREETFIMLQPGVSETSHTLMIQQFSQCGFRPNVIYSPSIFTSFLYVQSGIGVGLFDSRSNFIGAPGVRFINTDQVASVNLVAAWRQDNVNEALIIFKKSLSLCE